MAILSESDIQLFERIFDEKIKGLHIKMDAEFTVVNSELRQIRQQTTLTNSRVNHLEDDVKLINKDLGDIKIETANHKVECPAIEKIDKIDQELIEYKVFKKYPKIGIGILAVACLLFIVSTWLVVSRVGINTKSVEANTEQSIKSDSLNYK